MIYLVSNDIDRSSWEGVSKMSVEESKKMILSWPVVQFDTETTGIDPHICSLISMQFGNKDFSTGKSDQIVVDCKSVPPEEYRKVIEASYLVGHNLKFDLKFLFNHTIVPRNVYDTMIIEQLFYMGYKPGKVTFNLHDVLLRNTGIELDKTLQKEISYIGLTEDGLKYAAADVVFLQDLRKAQLTVAKARNCIRATVVENRFIPAIAYLEWCGVHLDVNKWKEKMKRDQDAMNKYLDELNNYVLSSTALNTEFVSTTSDSNGDNSSSFSLFSFEPKCIVDWNSPKQVVPVFKKLGFNTTITDPTTGKFTESINEKQIAFQRGVADDFLDAYLSYKGAYKAVTSYGQGHINQINPVTNRIHTEFRQIGTVTGRMASGSKKPNKDLAKLKGLRSDLVTYCNMQNLPSKGEEGKLARACFTAQEGNTFVSCDYSAEESRVQADVWNEKSLLESFEQGIDTHNLYAKLCFPEELKDVDVRDVKKVRPDLRQAAKSAEFALGYGSDGSAIARSIGMSKEKAREMVAGILKGMPGMASFKKNAIKFLKKNGYLVINDVTGHRIYWPEWSHWKSVEDTFDRDFWENYNLYHKGTEDSVVLKVRKHNAISKDWFEKNVLNYPIQGGSAIVLKQAAADLFDWVVENGYFGKILFCVFVHDEIDCECPSELADTFSKVMQQIMQRAASIFYHRLPIPAEASTGDHWIH